MAHDENGNYRDENAQAQWKDAFSESLGASLEGRHQLMPKVYRDPLKNALDSYNKNEFDESEHIFRGKGEYNKRAALMLAMTKVAQREHTQPTLHPVLLLAMTKKAAQEKEAQGGMEDILKQYVDPWARSAYSGAYGPQGFMGGLPGKPWMYSTGLGAGAGGLIGGYFGHPMAGTLIGGGLSYLLHNWMKNRYGQAAADTTKPATTPVGGGAQMATTALTGGKQAPLSKIQREGMELKGTVAPTDKTVKPAPVKNKLYVDGVEQK